MGTKDTLAGPVIRTRLTLHSRVGAIAAGMEAKAEKIVAKAALDVQANAQAYAPVDTGLLRASIRTRKIGPCHWQVIVGVDYGAYVEYGTRYQAAQPFLNRALDAIRGPFLDAMKRVV